MLQQISPYLPYFPYIVGGFFVLSVLMLLAAAYYLRRRRKALVWRNRHDAGKVGGRLLFTGLTMLFSSVIIGVFSGVVIYSFDYTDEFFPPRNPYGLSGVAISYIGTPTLEPTHTPAPTETPSETSTPIPPTPSSTMTMTAIPLPTEGASETPLPTMPPAATEAITAQVAATDIPVTQVAAAGGPQQVATFVPTETPLIVAGVATEVPPTVNLLASVEIISADDDITNGTPQVAPTLIFQPGVTRLYFYVEYEGMANGLKWSRILYRDGSPVGGGAYVWSLGQDGESYFVFSNQDGFDTGNYEVRLFLNNRVIQTFQFEIADSSPSRSF